MSRTALSHPNFFVVFILSIIRIIVQKFHSLINIYKERLFKLLTEKGRHILWLILLCKFGPASFTDIKCIIDRRKIDVGKRLMNAHFCIIYASSRSSCVQFASGGY